MKGRSLILAVLFTILFAGAAFAAPTLKQGAEGDDVRLLQSQLREAGYTTGADDGVFGYSTYRAVIAFQRDEKIHITGVVDRETWAALKKRAKKDASKKGGEKITAGAASVSSAREGAKSGPSAGVPEVKALKNAPFLPKGKIEKIISTAKKYTGTRYAFGGTTPKGFDCSGFVQYVFKENGYSIARTADEQYKLGKAAKKRSELTAGDLVFFSTYEKGASHCGIYLGKNEFIHVSTSKGVRVDSLDDPYWKPRWYGGRHIVK